MFFQPYLCIILGLNVNSLPTIQCDVPMLREAYTDTVDISGGILMRIYHQPEHLAGTVHPTKQDAESDGEH